MATHLSGTSAAQSTAAGGLARDSTGTAGGQSSATGMIAAHPTGSSAGGSTATGGLRRVAAWTARTVVLAAPAGAVGRDSRVWLAPLAVLPALSGNALAQTTLLWEAET